MNKKSLILILIVILLMLLTLLGFSQNKASYYASSFHGRKTASGEIFNQNKLTCAHKTLPFGTLLKVTNILTGKWVIVTVNDRGPFVKSRIVDLSLAAFKQIGNVESGVIKVIIEKI